MAPSRKSYRILFFSGRAEEDAALLGLLNERGVVRIVKDAEAAMKEIRAQRFDAIVTDSSDIHVLARAFQPTPADAILERLGQGVCIVNARGELVWANSRLRSYPSHVVDLVRTTCLAILNEAAEKPGAPAPPIRRRTVNLGHDYYFDITASTLPETDGAAAQLVAVIFDATATRRLQEKVNAIDAAGRELVGLDAEALAACDVGERLRLLEEKIVRYSRDLMHFDHFVIRVLDRQTNKLDAVLGAGMSEEARSLEIFATPEGNGISGYVAATGRSYICPDVSKDSRYLPGIGNARSSLTVPLRLHDQIIGVFNIESNEVAAFSEDDRQFAEIFGRYVAIALHMLRLLAVERHTTTGQLAADVAAELAVPLNDIVTEASALMEECITQPGLRDRLRGIIDEVDQVKRRLHSVTASQVRGLVRTGGTDHDPALAGKRILVADDEDIIRETIASVLSQAGALTVMARDGREALTILHAQPFDLVLSDIKMPHHDGYEIFAAAKAANPASSVILMTGFGYDPNHSIVRASKEGLAGVLFKPFKVDKLLETIRHALSHAPAGS